MADVSCQFLSVSNVLSVEVNFQNLIRMFSGWQVKQSQITIDGNGEVTEITVLQLVLLQGNPWSIYYILLCVEASMCW